MLASEFGHFDVAMLLIKMALILTFNIRMVHLF